MPEETSGPERHNEVKQKMCYNFTFGPTNSTGYMPGSFLPPSSHPGKRSQSCKGHKTKRWTQKKKKMQVTQLIC